MASRPRQISISITPERLEALDARAEAAGLTRSAYISRWVDDAGKPQSVTTTSSGVSASVAAIKTEPVCDHQYVVNKQLAFDTCMKCNDKRWH